MAGSLNFKFFGCFSAHWHCSAAALLSLSSALSHSRPPPMFSFVRGAASLTSSLLSGVAGTVGGNGSSGSSGGGDYAQLRREVATLQNRLRNAQVLCQAARMQALLISST
jgi:hypothetical protein